MDNMENIEQYKNRFYNLMESKSGKYQGNKGTFRHFKRTAMGDVVCSFRTDDTNNIRIKKKYTNN